MEYLDTYDENKKYLGKQTRDYVHQNAIWHNTVHCWLYDSEGNIYFQIRKDSKTFYTTASGHVLAGETIKEAFSREIKEEIGIDIEHNNAALVGIVTFKMDKTKKDGSVFKDRAFANVYVHEFNDSIDKFAFDLNELDGLVKVNAKEALELFEKEDGNIQAEVIINTNGKNIVEHKNVSFKDFLVNEHETAIKKYGDILNKVIELTSNN